MTQNTSQEALSADESHTIIRQCNCKGQWYISEWGWDRKSLAAEVTVKGCSRLVFPLYRIMIVVVVATACTINELDEKCYEKNGMYLSCSTLGPVKKSHRMVQSTAPDSENVSSVIILDAGAHHFN